MNRNEQEWTEMKRNEQKWKEMKRNEQKWTEMKRNEKKWTEVKTMKKTKNVFSSFFCFYFFLISWVSRQWDNLHLVFNWENVS